MSGRWSKLQPIFAQNHAASCEHFTDIPTPLSGGHQLQLVGQSEGERCV